MKPKYSVIIPIYKAENTLHRCVESLLSQERTDVEIILVNDGSPDKCGVICEQYERDYPQIRYIAKENGGVSTARNAGIDAAEGKYLLFVDSDDYVSEEYFGAIEAALSEYDWDLLRFSAYITDGNIKRLCSCMEFSGKSREEIGHRLIGDICSKSLNSPWAKVYKREIVEKYGIRFPVGASVAEDRAFNIAYSTHLSSYYISPKPLYYVSTENGASLSRKRYNDLEAQFAITGKYARDAISKADISDDEKRQYLAALNFGDARVIYKRAKELHRDSVPFLKRLRMLHKLIREINQKKYEYPKTRYCTLITLPIKLNLALIIDIMAWVLVHR